MVISAFITYIIATSPTDILFLISSLIGSNSQIINLHPESEKK